MEHRVDKEFQGMASQHQQPIHIFLSSAPADESLCKQLLAHMDTLIQEGRITLWHSANILAGSNTTKESTDQLNKAQIILLLISANFFASPSCQTEMRQALARHDAKQAWVIPV